MPTVPSRCTQLSRGASCYAPVLLGAALVAGCGTGPTASKPSDSSALQVRLTKAFDIWEDLPSTCAAVIVASSVKQATADGASWAIASFKPPSPCYKVLAPAGAGQPPRTELQANVGPWTGNEPVIGVFEISYGNWEMNEEGGHPFPCPSAYGHVPGPGNGALPPAVVQAWHLHYASASACEHVEFPTQPAPTSY